MAYSYSSSSTSYSSGGHGGTLHGGSIGAGSLSSVAMSRKTNISRTPVAQGGSMMLALSSLHGGNATYAGTHDHSTTSAAFIANRAREQHDLQDLNKKLADYIGNIGWYKAKVEEQKQIIATFTGKFESMEAKLRSLYDKEMATLRATIDATTRDKAAVELKVDTLESLYKDFRVKYEQELAAHESTRTRLPKLEKECSEKDAQIDYLAKTLSSLEPQVALLKTQISTYQKEAIDAKMATDAEIVRRCELESKLVTKEDEIAFLKRVYEEKLRMALDLDIDQVDIQAIYSKELANALCDIRAEYQAQLEAIKGSGDDTWLIKIHDLMHNSEKQTKELKMSKEEVVKWRSKYSECMSTIETLKGRVRSLEANIASMSEEFKTERGLHAVAIENRDLEIADLKRQIAAHCLELKGLRDLKLSLVAEIAEYRRLLILLRGGPDPTPIVPQPTGGAGGGGAAGGAFGAGGAGGAGGGGAGGAFGAGGAGGAGGGGGAGGAFGAGGAGGAGASMSSGASGMTGMTMSPVPMTQSTAQRTTFQAMSKGRGAITETSPDGRYIVVENKSAASLDIGGWVIERCVDMGDVIVYKFPADAVLNALASVKIWPKGANGATLTAGNLIWEDGNTWGMAFNATNELKDAGGVIEASLTQKTMLG